MESDEGGGFVVGSGVSSLFKSERNAQKKFLFQTRGEGCANQTSKEKRVKDDSIESKGVPTRLYRSSLTTITPQR